MHDGTLRVTAVDLAVAQREIPATASQPGVVIRMPPPMALDAYAQFIKNGRPRRPC